jgi:hypothetical protein
LPAILLFTGSAHAAAIADSPRAFLERLYSGYTPKGKGNDFAYPEARAIVDAPLLALLHRDQIGSKGEVDAMDSDPVCQCQDRESLKVLCMHTQVDGAWKIQDLSWHGKPGLQAYLRDYKY